MACCIAGIQDARHLELVPDFWGRNVMPTNCVEKNIKGCLFASLLMTAIPYAGAEESTKAEVEQLKKQIELLQQQVQRIESTLSQPGDQISTPPSDTEVDLTQEEYPSLEQYDQSHVLAKPWYQNFDVSGFGAAGYYDTGDTGTKPDGGFEVKEASLFISADVWENTRFFVELQTNRLGKDDQLFTRTGEVYIHFLDLIPSVVPSVGLKLGRFDIPFGEEYLWQDAIDNPLITNSAAYPYGWDEGILIHGQAGGIGWIAAISDGTDQRSIEDDTDKAFNLKFYGRPLEPLYLSASAMKNGDAGKSAFEFGGSHFQPIGASHQSTLAASPSEKVDATLLQLDLKYSFLSSHTQHELGYLALSFGVAEQQDSAPGFDRDIRWFSIEPLYHLTPKTYLIARYSEIGTYDDDKGFHFDGKIFADGNNAFGYDTKRFRRLGIGVGWMPAPRIRAKLEVGRDRFELIDASPLSTNNNDRKFVGAEVAVGF